MFKKFIISLLLVCFTGCASFKAGWEKDASKWLLPVNVAAAYFGSVALHEGGHAITGELLGADDVRVDVLPTRDNEGVYHLGLTTIKSEGDKFSDADITLFRAMGPTAALAGHVLTRELLKTNALPKIVQPTFAWFELFNHIGFYYHVFNGIGGNKYTDLGQEDVWISWAMLGGVLIYDLYDIFFDDLGVLEGIERRFAVLFGEKFYESKPSSRRIKLLAAPTKGGGFLGIGFDW